MTVAVKTSKAGPYIGDGVQKSFPYTFPVTDLSHVQVYVNGVVQAKGVEVQKGTVVFAAPPKAKDTVTLLRVVPITQETDIQNNTAFYPEIMEAAYDKLTMICQQLAEELERCIKTPPGMDDDGSLAESIGRLALLVDDALRAAADAIAALEEIRRLLAKSALLGNYITVNSVDSNGFLVCDKDSLPHAVTTNTGTIFYLEKGSVTETASSYLIDSKPYLAYMNATTFTGPWYVWRTGGMKGDPGKPGSTGAPGKSAYEVAVANGFKGTQKEWLASLSQDASGYVDKHNTSATAHEDLFKRITNPPGTVIAFAGSATPAGYLLCNGAAVSRKTYAGLFSVIGTAYGAGDGATTFNLPNLTDRFIQGSGAPGTVKAAGLPNITGGFRASPVNDNRNVSGAFSYTNTYNTNDEASGHSDTWGTEYKFDASKSNSIYGKSTTVQPPALTMRYLIKY